MLIRLQHAPRLYKGPAMLLSEFWMVGNLNFLLDLQDIGF